MKLLIATILFYTPLQAACRGDYITYVEGDVYHVIDYKSKHDGVEVLVSDWYESTEEWYYCDYEESWCYPKFYPTLAVRHGLHLDK